MKYNWCLFLIVRPNKVRLKQKVRSRPRVFLLKCSTLTEYCVNKENCWERNSTRSEQNKRCHLKYHQIFSSSVRRNNFNATHKEEWPQAARGCPQHKISLELDFWYFSPRQAPTAHTVLLFYDVLLPNYPSNSGLSKITNLLIKW